MLNPNPNSPCGLLYVDDEEKALKYFRKALESKFPVFTAISAEEGLEILRRDPGQIGVVLSDQRMPEMKGAEFLGVVREEFPMLVRILTTAYSDLSSAIEAVNTGHIYQYVVKPWETPELVMTMQRASDYFHVLSERNSLLGLKMTALQRIVCSDRVKWLLLWSRGLEESGQVVFRRALATFVKALPEGPPALAPGGTRVSARQFELSHLLHGEFRHASACLDELETFRAKGDWTTAGALAALAERLPGEVAVQAGEDGVVEMRLAAESPFDVAAFTGSLFALLIGSGEAARSLALFQALLALAANGRSLRIVVESSGTEFQFISQGSSADAADVIDLLCEKFAAADISRL